MALLMNNQIDESEEWAKIMNKLINYNWNVYKLEAADCSPNMTIDEGIIAEHSGKPGWNFARTNLPIPVTFSFEAKKSSITFYYEVEILNGNGIFVVGFSDPQYPFQKNGFGGKNSIAKWPKGELLIDDNLTVFRNDGGWVKKGNVVGIGIINQPNSKMECFATLNGRLLGKSNLPRKFVHFDLFPTVTMNRRGQKICMKFDRSECQFKEFGRVFEI